jgi:hypothetical protein
VVVVSQTPPLPASALEYWHGELGASAANAVGQIAGITMPGAGTPTVGPDGAFFNAKNVYQSSISGNRYWYRTNAPGTIIAAGTRPYLYIIGRFRTVPASQQEIAGFGQHASGARLQVTSTAAAVLQGWFGRTVFGLITVTNGTADTGVHRYEAWMDASDCNFRVDGVNAQGAALGDTIGLINSAGIGTAPSFGSVETADASLAFMLLCTAKPTDPEITALNAWATAYWGAP